MRVLVLGGTAEGRELARRLHPHVDIISSLAGRVPDPALPVGPVRIGGFGVESELPWPGGSLPRFGSAVPRTRSAARIDEVTAAPILPPPVRTSELMPLAIALASDHAPPGTQGRLVILMSSGVSIGSTVSGLLATQIVRFLGWPWIFV